MMDGVFNSVYEMKQEGQAGRLGRVVLPKTVHLWTPLMAPSSFSFPPLFLGSGLFFRLKPSREDRRSYSTQSPAPGVWEPPKAQTWNRGCSGLRFCPVKIRIHSQSMENQLKRKSRAWSRVWCHHPSPKGEEFPVFPSQSCTHPSKTGGNELSLQSMLGIFFLILLFCRIRNTREGKTLPVQQTASSCNLSVFLFHPNHPGGDFQNKADSYLSLILPNESPPRIALMHKRSIFSCFHKNIQRAAAGRGNWEDQSKTKPASYTFLQLHCLLRLVQEGGKRI